MFPRIFHDFQYQLAGNSRLAVSPAPGRRDGRLCICFYIRFPIFFYIFSYIYTLFGVCRCCGHRAFGPPCLRSVAAVDPVDIPVAAVMELRL